MSLKLAYAQVAYALSCQKKGGSFIIKVFDTFTPASIDLLYILASVYERVYFSNQTLVDLLTLKSTLCVKTSRCRKASHCHCHVSCNPRVR